MQLRRGPPDDPHPAATSSGAPAPKAWEAASPHGGETRTPALRLVKAPSGPTRATPRARRWAWIDSYSIRVMAGILLLSIPISVVLGLGEDTWHTHTLTHQDQPLAEPPPP